MRTHLRLPCGCLLLLLGVALAPSAGLAQGQIGDMDTLLKAYDRDIPRRKELFKGEAAATGAGDKKIAEACAKWFIYRITHQSVVISPPVLAKVHFDFNVVVGDLMAAESRKTNRAFVNMFGVALVECMKDVLKENASGKPHVYVNACMMMPAMAKLKQNDVGDYLVSLVNDPKATEVARLHALKGLKEFLPVDSLDDDIIALKGATVIGPKKARDVKYVDTLTKYIETPVKVDKMTPEEAAAVNFVRREAIISLASAEAPAVAAIKKTGKIEGGVAPTLLRVIAGNLEPAPTLPEKIEAALGLCKMRYWNPNGSAKIKNAHQDEYQAELANFLVGKTLDELIGAYKADFENFGLKATGRKLPRIPFKVEAKRFEAALTEMAKNAETSPASANAEKLKKEAMPILLKMAKGVTGSYENVDNDQIFRQKVVPAMRPKTGYVFKTLKTAEIQLPNDAP